MGLLMSVLKNNGFFRILKMKKGKKHGFNRYFLFYSV